MEPFESSYTGLLGAGVDEVGRGHVSDVRVSAGAGFVVVYMGRVLTMPGLPKVPREIEQV